MTIFKTGKLQFTKANNSINTDVDGKLLLEFASPKAKQLKIELIEISKIANPSDIQIEIVVDSVNLRLIHLYKHRSQFILQNDLFILDTKDLKDFTINLPNVIFQITVHSEKDFNMTVYYSTDQQKELHHFQAL
jgi:hypothetical protein